MEKLGDILRAAREQSPRPAVIPSPEASDIQSDEEKADPKEYWRKSLRITDMEHTFKNFKPRAGSKLALRAFRAIADGTTDKPFLFCYGTTGNGKTHLIEATILRWLERGIICRYLVVEEFLAMLRRAMNENARTGEAELFDRFCANPYMVLDDLAIEQGTPWQFSRLEELIRRRDAGRLVTIMTTNRDIQQLFDEGNMPRLLSRFSDPDKSEMILNGAIDYRLREAK